MQHWFTYPTNVDPVAIHLGPINIHWYGISYLIGFVCVFLWMNRPAGRRRLGLTTEQIQDFLFYALVGVLVGGRTFFVINDIISKHDASFYFQQPINFIAVWNGGMAFHGGLVGVIVATWLFVRKHPGLKFSVLGDEVVVLLPIGITLTRIVNFINDELWGDVCSPDHPWCLIRSGAGSAHAARSPLALRAQTQRRRRRMDLVYDLRHHALGRRALAASRLHLARHHRRPAVRAPHDRDRHRDDRLVQSP
jgi:prolipoprotein diacylglyceryl transferase